MSKSVCNSQLCTCIGPTEETEEVVVSPGYARAQDNSARVRVVF